MIVSPDKIAQRIVLIFDRPARGCACQQRHAIAAAFNGVDPRPECCPRRRRAVAIGVIAEGLVPRPGRDASEAEVCIVPVRLRQARADRIGQLTDLIEPVQIFV